MGSTQSTWGEPGGGGGGGGAMAQPFPGLRIAAPERMPQQGEVVIRYEAREGKSGGCECSDLNQSGLIALVALIFVFWPLSFITCCIKRCHEGYQVPVYGPPSQVPVGTIVAPPAQGIPSYGKDTFERLVSRAACVSSGNFPAD